MDIENLRTKDVEWVVNSAGELGVKIGSRFFWLYKGESLEMIERSRPPETHRDGTPLSWRRVEKREFGESCEARGGDGKYTADGDRYIYGEGWEPIPMRPRGN